MKKTKLALGRETIRHLRSPELLGVIGGAMSPGGGGPIESDACSGAQTCGCPGTPTWQVCTSLYCQKY